MKKEFIGINLNHIKRIPVNSGELGYGRQGIPLDHYYMDFNAPLGIYDSTKSMAVLKLSFNSDIVTAYVRESFFDNIETIESVIPGYKKIILTWFNSDSSGVIYDN